MKPAAAINCSYTAARIRVVDVELTADISVPENARGLIVFGDGVGVGRHNPSHHRIAKHLNLGGFATVLADLISEDENAVNRHTGEACSGVDLLERRVVAIADWIAMQPELRDLPLAFFGEGPGAEAALIASTRRPEIVRAIVSCGPRLEHIEGFLGEIFAPALFIYGNDEERVASSQLDRQRIRIARLPSLTIRELEFVGSSNNILAEPDAVDQIIAMAQKWYARHLTA
jgi:putative phosphoribosyl transferase